MISDTCIIGKNVKFGKNVVIKHNCIIEDNVIIGDNVFIDSNTIIRSYSSIGAESAIGSNCIIGEYWNDFYADYAVHDHPLLIGNNALIRSGSIVYAGSTIGNRFQTGHQVTIREKSCIGDSVSIGTLSDIQGNCSIGNYVRMHSNVHIGQLAQIDDFVWIFPYVVLTNDPTPPSENFAGVHVHSFAIIATGSVIMPGLDIGQDALVGAGAIVTKSVPEYSVFVGNPAAARSDVRRIINKVTGEASYPWRYHFSRYMPWDGIGFDSWYSSLNDAEKKHYKIDTLL